jgi:WD40 repeat protein/transcriptional regulator with XRE-family HTH domain
VTTRPPFHEQLRHERELRGWSQADLAEKVDCDTKTVGRWEGGIGFPRPYHRQKLCETFGKNAEELGLVREYVSQPLDFEEVDVDDHLLPLIHEEDWGEAPYAVNLYGRDDECAELAQWIVDHHCQVVAVLGMGGVGKTAVAAKVAVQMRKNFEYVFWRSLQNVPPLELILKQCIGFVSHQQHLDAPWEIDGQVALLMQYLRDHRCLLVLDNFESVMQPGQRAGRYSKGYAAYGRLLQRVGEIQHQSCLLLTGREKPREVALLEGTTSPVRSLYLSGLPLKAGRQMLQDKGLVGSDANWQALLERYSGNPLALKVVSASIQEVFDGNIASFLQEEAMAFGDINDLLDQQFQRLTAAEQEVMSWLAIEREAVPLNGLRGNLVSPVSAGTQLEVLDSLRRRSLVEVRGQSEFTLQPVIMEYVTMSLIERAFSEFDSEAADVWRQFAFCKAQAKDYVRESQVRLLLEPIAQRLLATLGREGIEQRARKMLERQRVEHAQQPGYLAGNIINLLSHLHCNLRGFDFSHLVLRQAHLQRVMLPDVNFSYTHFSACTFASTFGNILAVACSPRGDVLAAGTTSGEIWIYEALSGALRLTCRGHSDGVWSLAFSPDGSRLASSSDDQTIRLWDSNSGRCLRLWQDHTDRVRATAFSPDGGTLASGSDDQTIRLWNIDTGERLKMLHGHTGRVWSVAYSPNGKLLASGSTDLAVCVWDICMESCLTALLGHNGWIRSVAFHPRGSILASGSDDQTIRLWDANTGQCLKTLSGHTSRVWSVAFHPAGEIIASSSEDQTIRLWDSSTGRCSLLLQGHYQGVRSVDFTPDGHMLVSGGDDQAIRVWDVSSGNCLRTMQGYTNRIWSLAFHPDGSMLASACEDSVICLWDVKTGQRLKLLEDRSHGVLAVACDPRGVTLASGGQDQTVRVWDVQSGRSLHILQGHTNWVRTVIYSPDGKLLASGGEDHTIRLWDVKTGTCLCTLQGHTSWVRSLAFKPNGSLLASGADDQTIRLWHVDSGLHLKTLEGHTGRVRSVAFSPDGKLLASGGEDQFIRLWDVDTGTCLGVLQGHADWVRSIAFSPDGKLLASGGEDQFIRLWDIGSKSCLKALRGHTNRVRWVTFSPCGNTIASCSDDGTIKCWDAQTYGCFKTLIGERPYERMNISHVQGLTEAQIANLKALGAIEAN